MFALYVTSIIDALLMSYALWAPTVLIPFVAGVMFNIKNPKAALYAMFFGAIMTIVWKWGPFNLVETTKCTNCSFCLNARNTKYVWLLGIQNMSGCLYKMLGKVVFRGKF